MRTVADIPTPQRASTRVLKTWLVEKPRFSLAEESFTMIFESIMFYIKWNVNMDGKFGGCRVPATHCHNKRTPPDGGVDLWIYSHSLVWKHVTEFHDSARCKDPANINSCKPARNARENYGPVLKSCLTCSYSKRKTKQPRWRSPEAIMSRNDWGCTSKLSMPRHLPSESFHQLDVWNSRWQSDGRGTFKEDLVKRDTVFRRTFHSPASYQHVAWHHEIFSITAQNISI